MKKTFIYTTIWLILAMIVPLGASAYDFQVGNIYYKINGEGTVSVTYKDTNLNSYSGTVTIPATVSNNGVTYTVTEIGSSAFRASSGLVRVNLPSTMQTIGYASFYNCRALAYINIPNSVTYIDSFAFRQCTSLTEITIPGSIPYMGGQVFQGCTGLRQVTIQEGLTGLSAATFYQCSALESIVIPSTVTDIYMMCFADCTSLTDVTIPSTTTYIDSSAFDNTPWLNNQPDGVVYAGCIAYMYKGTMPAGTTITLRNGTVTMGTRLFDSQDGLVGLNIPASLAHIDASCVIDCQNLVSIKVASGNTTFDSRNNCNAIIETATNTLILGCNASQVPSSVTAIGTTAFTYCNGLSSTMLNDNITSIGDYAYSYCSGITRVEIPASLTSIGRGAFAGCTNATSVTVNSGNPVYDSRQGCNAIIETATNTLIAGFSKSFIPEGITAIGDYAFYWQYLLSSITIPASVTRIGDMAFYYMNNLETIVCEATTPPSISSAAFENNAILYATLYVPRASLETYQNTDVWNWIHSIRAIEDLVNGDVDGDGKVGISDVTALIDYILNNDSRELNLYNADCDKNRKVDIADVSEVIDMLLGN